MTDPILLEITDGLARVTLNRPDSLNAVDFAMGARWRDVAREVTADPQVGAVLLDAAGPAFCAGGDVVAMATGGGSGADLAEMAGIINEGILAFASSAKPVVAAVGGAVAGGGLGLMLSADYVVASRSSRFVSRYANIGLTPDLGVTTLLPRAIGERRALQLLLTDTMIDATTALEWGLVCEVVDDDRLAARAHEVARFWLDNATAAFGQAKRLVRTGADRKFGENLADEAITIGRSFDGADAQARIAAFARASSRWG